MDDEDLLLLEERGEKKPGEPVYLPNISDIIDSSEALLEISNLKRNCVRCGLVYTEAKNVGHWKCRYFHPFFELAMPADAVYRCCNRRTGEQGCVEADHNDRYEERTGPTRVAPHTVALFGECKITPRNTRVDERTGVMLIDRFDALQYQAVTNPILFVSQKKMLEIQRKLAARSKT